VTISAIAGNFRLKTITGQALTSPPRHYKKLRRFPHRLAPRPAWEFIKTVFFNINNQSSIIHNQSKRSPRHFYFVQTGRIGYHNNMSRIVGQLNIIVELKGLVASCYIAKRYFAE